jgi:L-threonylcarbamoyladenylate synthase
MLRTELSAVSDAALARAAELLTAGELVAFPTETVYGLGARADSEEAVRKIFEAKGRPADKPLIVHVLGIERARAFAREWPDEADKLARAFWPGPLTLVLPRAPWVPDAVTAGGDSVALRAPAHAAAIALLERCAFSIAAPSANLSGEPPPTSAQEVMRALEGRIAYILDGGATPLGTPSTLVDLCSAPARVLRQGAVARARIAELVPILGVEETT